MQDSAQKSSPQGMKTFFIVWGTQFISMLGSDLSGFALGVWIYTQTHQATPFAIAVLFNTLPRVLLAPIAGTVADRFSRRWLMIFADLGNALITLAMAIIFWMGHMQVWMIYIVSFLTSITQAFQEPAYSASVTMLVPKEQFTRASGLIQLGQSVQSILTPLIAGLLFGVIGLSGLFMINFATCLPAIILLLMVRIPQPRREDLGSEKKTTLLQDALYGWKYLAERSGLMGLTMYFALVNFLLSFASVLTTPLVLSTSNATGLGIVQMTLGIGMLLGSLLISIWGGPKKNRIGVIIGAIMLMAVGFIVVGIRPGAVFVGAGYFLTLFVLPFASAISRAITQAKVAPEVQGRVFAIRGMISQALTPLAVLISGPLADKVFEPMMQPGGRLANGFVGNLLGTGLGRGIGFMFVLAGIVLIIVSAVTALNPRIRNLETELPDVVPDATSQIEVQAAPAE